jgi:hypothetical protein
MRELIQALIDGIAPVGGALAIFVFGVSVGFAWCLYRVRSGKLFVPGDFKAPYRHIEE